MKVDSTFVKDGRLTRDAEVLLDDPVVRILEPLRERKSELRREMENVRAKLEVLAAEEKRLDRVLRAAEPPTEKEKPKKRAASVRARAAASRSEAVAARSYVRAADADRERVLAFVREQAEPVTSREVSKALGFPPARAADHLNVLRERQLVRRAGRRPTHGNGHPPYLWAAMEVTHGE